MANNPCTIKPEKTEKNSKKTISGDYIPVKIVLKWKRNSWNKNTHSNRDVTPRKIRKFDPSGVLYAGSSGIIANFESILVSPGKDFTPWVYA